MQLGQKWDACLDRRRARSVDIQLNRDAGFFGRAAEFRPSDLHFAPFNQTHPPNTKPKPFPRDRVTASELLRWPGACSTSFGSGGGRAGGELPFELVDLLLQCFRMG